mgnify:CR=1 FL=1
MNEIATKDYKIIKHKCGFYEVSPKPTELELQKFYKKKYFQNDIQYQHKYDEQELNYINIMIKRKFDLLHSVQSFNTNNPASLEVGIGEGWTLSYMSQLGFDVLGLDYTDYAVKNHNPSISNKIITGNPIITIDKLISEGKKYELIWLDNVLEHSPNPVDLLYKLNTLGKINSNLVIEVPNDYSIIQLECLERGFIKNKFWECPPEHLCYFSPESLKRLCKVCGWNFCSGIADFPVDIFLFNKYSNYNSNTETGKESHIARMNFELMISKQNKEKVISFYNSMINLGIGRDMTMIFKKA